MQAYNAVHASGWPEAPLDGVQTYVRRWHTLQLNCNEYEANDIHRLNHTQVSSI